MRSPEYYAAVFGIIKNENWEILMIKRKNTGYMDGYYWLPAGHIEWKEAPTLAMQREILEEVWLHIVSENLKLINITYRIQEDRVVVDFYFEALSYIGSPINAEPEKSEWIYWIDWKKEGKIQFRETLKRIERSETFSEIDFRNL